MLLSDVFGSPHLWTENDDLIELFMDGFSCTFANEVDLGITESVRSMLFLNLPHPMVGPDLLSLNINRGREHGLPDYNTVRQHVGLKALTSFDQISSDSALNAKLESVYGDINDVDLFIGVLAEDHEIGSSFGETSSRIILEQFKRSRDADRFWYESYIEDDSVLEFIEYMDLGKVIAMTTDTDLSETRTVFQADVFISPITVPATVDDNVLNGNENVHWKIPMEDIDRVTNHLANASGVFSVTLSMEDMVIIGLVLVNVVTLVILCFVCCGKRSKRVRYQRVVVDSDLSDMEILNGK